MDWPPPVEEWLLIELRKSWAEYKVKHPEVQEQIDHYRRVLSMPLKKGGGKAAVSQNIKELYNNGTKKRSRKQIVAIAESAARGGKKRKKK